MAYSGKYKPKNPEKYIGDITDVVYRSLWERKCMVEFDTNPNYLRWGSEVLVIPYQSPLDNKIHRYFTDFVVEYIDKDGEKKQSVIEVKPDKQTRPPTPPAKPHWKSKQKFVKECKTYAVNEAKWKAAEAWCEKNNMEFIILTEKHIKPDKKAKRTKKNK